MKSLLKPDALNRLKPGAYFFDLAPNCEAVYFSNEQDLYFGKRDIRVPVGIKQKQPPTPICYCLGHTLESARAEIQATGQSTVSAHITKEIQAGNCACEVKNPSGRCCLGEVNKAVQKLLSELESVAALAHR